MRRLLIVLPLAASAPAAAEIDNAKADKLFAEASALRAINPAQACAKFGEALIYNPQAIATLLNVAGCDEQQGRIASAAAKYRELIDRATDQQQNDYKKEAETRLAAIANDIPHVTLSFATAPQPNTQVVIDNKVVTITGKTRLEIDPGERKIVVTAPGHVANVTTIIVAKQDDKSLVLPVLTKAGANTWRTLGKISVLSGGSLFAASVGIALVAKQRYDGACSFDKERQTQVCANGEALSRLNNAKTLGNVGTVVGIVGLVTAAVGGVLWWRSPITEQTTGVTKLGVSGDTTQIGLTLDARF